METKGAEVHTRVRDGLCVVEHIYWKTNSPKVHRIPAIECECEPYIHFQRNPQCDTMESRIYYIDNGIEWKVDAVACRLCQSDGLPIV
jgi:hypothetical protein